MKKIWNEYKEQIKYFLTNQKYMISIIIVAFLSYGFTITHYSIGVDDLCFDRYVNGTYILSAKRWGTWLLYNVLGIKEFSPFWLDFIVATFMVIIAIVLCGFIKKQYGDKIKIWGYIVFSCILISNPLINHFFIYQSTNLSIVISNLIIILSGIVIYENYFSENKKSVNIILGIILTIPISMYESCAQTYVVFLFATIFIKMTEYNKQTKEQNKKLFKYFCTGIGVLIIGILLYVITGKIVLLLLEKFGVLTKNYALNNTSILTVKGLSIKSKIQLFNNAVIKKFSYGIKNYLPVFVFTILAAIVLIVETIKLIKSNLNYRLISVLALISSNFILFFILATLLYRMQFSWIITTAFLALYVYQIFCDKKVIKYLINIIAILLIVIQTRYLNQCFYNDYKRYEKEKTVANDIAVNVVKKYDYKNKPLVFVLNRDEMKDTYRINDDNGFLLMAWGTEAFNEVSTEITKFINEQGYNFLYADYEEAENAIKEYEKLDEKTKSNAIVELDDIIIVNLNVYDF